MANNRLMLECARCQGSLVIGRLSVGAEDWSPARSTAAEADAWFAEHSVCNRGLGLSVYLVLENQRFASLPHEDLLKRMVRSSLDAHQALHSSEGAHLADRAREVWAELEQARADVDAAFRAGYHCQWVRDGHRSGYTFDPTLKPGDPDGALKAWRESR